MELTPFLFNDSPIWNEKVDGWLKQMPIYLQKECMKVHRKSLHTQPGFEINICHGGRAAIIVGENVYMQSSRHLVLLPGRLPHQVFPDEQTSYERTVVCWNDVGLNENAYNEWMPFLDKDWFSNSECRHFKLTAEEYVDITRILQRMENENSAQRAGWRRMMLSLLLELTVLLQRRLESLPAGPAEDERSMQASADHVSRYCEYVRTHLHEDLSLQRVARLFAVSPEHLTRTFRREKGEPFYRYVLLQRVMESKRLLNLNPEMSLTELAYSLGFASSTQFSRIFKTLTGETPSEYRLRLNDGR